MCFRVFLRFHEGFSNSWKIIMFHHVMGQKKTSMSQNLCLGSTRLIFYENSIYFNQTNPRNVFYVGKIGTDSVQLNK